MTRWWSRVALAAGVGAAVAACGDEDEGSASRSVELDVMVFNVEYGGEVVDFDAIIAAIEAADPDVVLLEEAELNTARIASELGWPYVDARTDVLSRFPVIEPPGAEGRYSFVEVSPGRVVAVANVHLPSDPYGPYAVRDGASAADVRALEEATRLPYIEPYLDVLSPLASADVPVFLGGDFNAPSHLDWTDAAVGSLPQIVYAMSWPVSVAVEAAGFHDSFRDSHPDPVATPGLTWWAGRPIVDDYPDHADPQDRIDLLYAAGPVRTLASRLVGEEGGPGVDVALPLWGSDHRAVVSTFRVTPAPMPLLVDVSARLLVAGDALSVRFHAAGEVGERVVVVATGGAPTAAIAEVSTGAGAPTDGTVEIATGGLAPGAYEALLVAPGGSVRARAPFWVEATRGSVVLSVDDADAIDPGDPVRVRWSNAPGNRWDWLGLYAAPADPAIDDYLGYVYTGSTVEGAGVFDEAAREISWPLEPGEYEIFYLLNDGYTMATSTSFTVR